MTEDGVAFDRVVLGTLSRPMLRRTLKEALVRAFPDLSRIDFEHVETLADGVYADGFSHDLPGGVRAFDEYGRMVVSTTGGEPSRVVPLALPVPCMRDLGDAGTLTVEEVSPTTVPGTPMSVVVDAGKIEGELEVGSAREGERMWPLGMEGTKKLSDLLIDEKVPKRQRALTPVVRDAAGVVWLAGVRMSEAHKVDENTEQGVRLIWEATDPKRGTRDDNER